MRAVPGAVALIVWLALAGCGGSSGMTGHGPSGPKQEAVEAVELFRRSLATRDADLFCEVTLSEIQEPNFREVHAPPGTCQERAEDLFNARKPNGAELAWELATQIEVLGSRLDCADKVTGCRRATVRVDNLPLEGGETTTASLPVSYAGGRWRVGHYYVEVERETPAQRRRDPIAASQQLLDSLVERDPKSFCEVADPKLQKTEFSDVGLPTDASCETNAREMFAKNVEEEETPPLWAREAQALLGPANLHCHPACEAATIKLESLPLEDGNLVSGELQAQFSKGRWRVEAVEQSPSNEAGQPD